MDALVRITGHRWKRCIDRHLVTSQPSTRLICSSADDGTS